MICLPKLGRAAVPSGSRSQAFGFCDRAAQQRRPYRAYQPRPWTSGICPACPVGKASRIRTTKIVVSQLEHWILGDDCVQHMKVCRYGHIFARSLIFDSRVANTFKGHLNFALSALSWRYKLQTLKCISSLHPRLSSSALSSSSQW